MKICIIKAAKFIINKSFIIESVKECSSEMFIHIKCCLKKGSYTVFFKKKEREREKNEESLLWILRPDLKHYKALDWISKQKSYFNDSVKMWSFSCGLIVCVVTHC